MKKYLDKYGQVWKRPEIEGHKYVYRIPDGNIGAWDNGRGLVETQELQKTKKEEKVVDETV